MSNHPLAAPSNRPASAAAGGAATRGPATTLVRALGLLDATTIVIGSMIGSGIFIAPALMAGYLQTPGLLVLLWILGGALTVCGALCYGELAAAMPHAGGQYVYLREAFGRLPGFLFGWTVFLVIQTGFIAAVGVAFAKYLGVFVPGISEQTRLVAFALPLRPGGGEVSFAVSSAQLVAIASIVLLTAVNYFGVRAGALVQNVFTIVKLAAVAALVLLVFSLGGTRGEGSAANFTPLFEPRVAPTFQAGFLAALAVAMSKALFAYDAWNSATFTSEEVREPHRNLPRALVLGALVVTGCYVLANLAYLYVVPIGRMAAVPDGRIASEAARMVLGQGGALFVGAAVVVSTFGCNNGLVLAGPRVYFAMARDGLFFQGCARIHPRYRTPHVALLVQGVWSCLLTLSGSYSDLLTYTTFASILFGALTVVGLIVLRHRRPDLPRPYRVPGYPLVPLVYLVTASAFLVYVVVGDLRNTMLGAAIVAAGVPAYFVWKRKA